MRMKVDERIRTLIENGVKTRHRSMFVIVGDKSRDQIVNLHYMLSKSVVKSRPNVLWCYKDKLEISSHKRNHQKQVKKLMQRLLDPEKVDHFSLFVDCGAITYCLYYDSERILGNTFGMCILQDVHERFRTESHFEAIPRFNEHFLLSLASCKACVVIDEELNILPISSHMRSINPVPTTEISHTSVVKGLSDGHQPSGDQIPWKFCEQFRDRVFPEHELFRIAVHPNAMRLGYGSTAVELLTRYYEGQLTHISEIYVDMVEQASPIKQKQLKRFLLLEENVKPRSNLRHLLVHLRERQPEKLHYLGVSFGLTLDLFRFWRKLKFAPFYIGQIQNNVTGEHSCMVIKPIMMKLESVYQINGVSSYHFIKKVVNSIEAEAYI